eukprot:IDg19829t1
MRYRQCGRPRCCQAVYAHLPTAVYVAVIYARAKCYGRWLEGIVFWEVYGEEKHAFVVVCKQHLRGRYPFVEIVVFGSRGTHIFLAFHQLFVLLLDTASRRECRVASAALVRCATPACATMARITYRRAERLHTSVLHPSGLREGPPSIIRACAQWCVTMDSMYALRAASPTTAARATPAFATALLHTRRARTASALACRHRPMMAVSTAAGDSADAVHANHANNGPVMHANSVADSAARWRTFRETQHVRASGPGTDWIAPVLAQLEEARTFRPA